MQWVPLYAGPSIEAQMLQEALRRQGIRSQVSRSAASQDCTGFLVGPVFERVLVADVDLRDRLETIEACLDFVRPSGKEGSPAKSVRSD